MNLEEKLNIPFLLKNFDEVDEFKNIAKKYLPKNAFKGKAISPFLVWRTKLINNFTYVFCTFNELRTKKLKERYQNSIPYSEYKKYLKIKILKDRL